MQITRLTLDLALSSPFVALADQPIPDLAEASLEDLLNVQVTSVFKKEQKLATAPGVDVAQIDANTYAISIRGKAPRRLKAVW